MFLWLLVVGVLDFFCGLGRKPPKRREQLPPLPSNPQRDPGDTEDEAKSGITDASSSRLAEAGAASNTASNTALPQLFKDKPQRQRRHHRDEEQLEYSPYTTAVIEHDDDMVEWMDSGQPLLLSQYNPDLSIGSNSLLNTCEPSPAKKTSRLKQKKVKGGVSARKGKQVLDKKNGLDAIEETGVAGAELDNDSLILYFLKGWPWDRGTDERHLAAKSKAPLIPAANRKKRRGKHARRLDDDASPHSHSATRVKRKPSSASANRDQKAGSDEISSKKPKMSLMDMIKHAMRHRGPKKRSHGKMRNAMYNSSAISVNTSGGAVAAENSARAGKSDSSGVGSLSRSGHLSHSKETYLDSLNSDGDEEAGQGATARRSSPTNTSALPDSSGDLLDEYGHFVVEDGRSVDMTTCSYSFSLGDDEESQSDDDDDDEESDNSSSLSSDTDDNMLPIVGNMVAYEEYNNILDQAPSLLLVPSLADEEGSIGNKDLLSAASVEQGDDALIDSTVEYCGLELYTIETTVGVNVSTIDVCSDNVDNDGNEQSSVDLQSTLAAVCSTSYDEENLNDVDKKPVVDSLGTNVGLDGFDETDDIVELCGLERYTVDCLLCDKLEIYSNSEVKSSLNLIYDSDEDDSSNDADDTCWQQLETEETQQQLETEETQQQQNCLAGDEGKTEEFDIKLNEQETENQQITESAELNNDDQLMPVEVEVHVQCESVAELQMIPIDLNKLVLKATETEQLLATSDDNVSDCENFVVKESEFSDNNGGCTGSCDIGSDNDSGDSGDADKEEKEEGKVIDLPGQASQLQADYVTDKTTNSWCDGGIVDSEKSTVQAANPARNMCVNQASTVNMNMSNASIIDRSMNIIPPCLIDLPSSRSDQPTMSLPPPVTTEDCRQPLMTAHPVATGGVSSEATVAEQDNNTGLPAAKDLVIDPSIDAAGVAVVLPVPVRGEDQALVQGDGVDPGREEEQGTIACPDNRNVIEQQLDSTNDGGDTKPTPALLLFKGSVEQDIPQQIGRLLGLGSTAATTACEEAALFGRVASPAPLGLAAGLKQPCAYPPATLGTIVTSTTVARSAAAQVTSDWRDSGVESGTVPEAAGTDHSGQDLGNEQKLSLSNDTSSTGDNNTGAGLEVDLCSQPRRPDHSQAASETELQFDFSTSSQSDISNGVDSQPESKKGEKTGTSSSTSNQLGAAAYFAEEWVDQLEVYFPLTSSYREKDRKRKDYVAALEVGEREHVKPEQVAEGTPSRDSASSDGCAVEEKGRDKGATAPSPPSTGGPSADVEGEAEVGRALPAASNSQQLLNELLECPSDTTTKDDRSVDSVAMDTVSQGVFFSSVLMPAMDTRLQGLAAGQVPSVPMDYKDNGGAGVTAEGDNCATDNTTTGSAGDPGKFKLVHHKAPQQQPKQGKGKRAKTAAAGDVPDGAGSLDHSRLQVIAEKEFDDLAQSMRDNKGSVYAVESIVEPPTSDASKPASATAAMSSSKTRAPPTADNGDDGLVEYVEGVMKESWREARRASLELNVDEQSDVARMSDLDSEFAPSSRASVSGAEDADGTSSLEATPKLKRRPMQIGLENALNELDAKLKVAEKAANSANASESSNQPVKSESDSRSGSTKVPLEVPVRENSDVCENSFYTQKDPISALTSLATESVAATPGDVGLNGSLDSGFQSVGLQSPDHTSVSAHQNGNQKPEHFPAGNGDFACNQHEDLAKNSGQHKLAVKFQQDASQAPTSDGLNEVSNQLEPTVSDQSANQKPGPGAEAVIRAALPSDDAPIKRQEEVLLESVDEQAELEESSTAEESISSCAFDQSLLSVENNEPYALVADWEACLTYSESAIVQVDVVGDRVNVQAIESDEADVQQEVVKEKDSSVGSEGETHEVTVVGLQPINGGEASSNQVPSESGVGTIADRLFKADRLEESKMIIEVKPWNEDPRRRVMKAEIVEKVDLGKDRVSTRRFVDREGGGREMKRTKSESGVNKRVAELIDSGKIRSASSSEGLHNRDGTQRWKQEVISTSEETERRRREAGDRYGGSDGTLVRTVVDGRDVRDGDRLPQGWKQQTTTVDTNGSDKQKGTRVEVTTTRTDTTSRREGWPHGWKQEVTVTTELSESERRGNKSGKSDEKDSNTQSADENIGRKSNVLGQAAHGDGSRDSESGKSGAMGDIQSKGQGSMNDGSERGVEDCLWNQVEQTGISSSRAPGQQGVYDAVDLKKGWKNLEDALSASSLNDLGKSADGSFDLDLFRAQVAELPDMLNEEGIVIRDLWEDQKVELQRSFSTSTVHSLNQSNAASAAAQRSSASVNCLNLAYDRLAGMPISDDVIQPSSINQSHSLNWLSGRGDNHSTANMQRRMKRPQSMPVHIDDSTCHYLYGIDSTVLPMSEKSVSVEDFSLIRTGSKAGLNNKHKSISLDSSKFNNDDDNEVTPENVFGGTQDVDWNQIDVSSSPDQWEAAQKSGCGKLTGNAMGSTSTLVLTPHKTTSTVECAIQVGSDLELLQSANEANGSLGDSQLLTATSSSALPSSQLQASGDKNRSPGKEDLLSTSKDKPLRSVSLDATEPSSGEIRELLQQALAMIQGTKTGQLNLGLGARNVGSQLPGLSSGGDALDGLGRSGQGGSQIYGQSPAADSLQGLTRPGQAVEISLAGQQPTMGGLNRQNQAGQKPNGSVSESEICLQSAAAGLNTSPDGRLRGSVDAASSSYADDVDNLATAMDRMPLKVGGSYPVDVVVDDGEESTRGSEGKAAKCSLNDGKSKGRGGEVEEDAITKTKAIKGELGFDANKEDSAMLNSIAGAVPGYMRNLDRWESEEILNKRLSQLRHSDGLSDPMLARDSRQYLSQQTLNDQFGSQRTIETQTYPEIRVIETQTKVDGIATDTNDDMPMSVDLLDGSDLVKHAHGGSNAKLIDTGVGCSPPRSPDPSAYVNEVEIVQLEVYRSAGKSKPTSFTAVGPGSVGPHKNNRNNNNVDPLVLDDDPPSIIIPDIDLSSSDEDLMVPPVVLPQASPKVNQSVTIQQPRISALSPARVEPVEIPNIVKVEPSLEELRKEHERFVRLMEQSKGDRAQAKARRKEQMMYRQRQFQADRASVSSMDNLNEASLYSPNAWDSMSSLLSPSEIARSYTQANNAMPVSPVSPKTAAVNKAATERDDRPVQLIINVEREREIVIQGSVPARVVNKHSELSLQDIEKDSLVDAELILTPTRRRLSSNEMISDGNHLRAPSAYEDKFKFPAGMLSPPSREHAAGHQQALERDYSPGSGRREPYIGNSANLDPLKSRSMESFSSLNSGQSDALRDFDPRAQYSYGEFDHRRANLGELDGDGQKYGSRNLAKKILKEPPRGEFDQSDSSQRSTPTIRSDSRSLSTERMTGTTSGDDAQLSATDIKRIMQRYEAIRRLVEEVKDDRPLSRASMGSGSLYEASETAASVTSSSEKRSDSTQQKRVHFHAPIEADSISSKNSRRESTSSTASTDVISVQKADQVTVGSRPFGVKAAAAAPSSRGARNVRETAIETDRSSTVSDLDELEKLRRERERIRAMLAKDLLPSRMDGIESAEAQLNYINGQTDVLLTSLNASPNADLGNRVLSSHTVDPESGLSLTTREYLNHYRTTLTNSERQLDDRIRVLERATPFAGVHNAARPASFTSASSDVDGSSTFVGGSTYNPQRQDSRRYDQIRQDVMHSTFASGRREVDDMATYGGGRMSYDLPEMRVTALERAQFLADSRKRLLLPYGMEPAGKTPLITSRLRASNRVVDEIDQTLDDVYGTHSDDLIKRQIRNSRWPSTPGHYTAAPVEPARAASRVGLAGDMLGMPAGVGMKHPPVGYQANPAPFDQRGGYHAMPTQFYGSRQPMSVTAEQTRARPRQDTDADIQLIIQKYAPRVAEAPASSATSTTRHVQFQQQTRTTSARH